MVAGTGYAELEQASGHGLVSHLNSELLSTGGAATSGAIMNKPIDVVFGKCGLEFNGDEQPIILIVCRFDCARCYHRHPVPGQRADYDDDHEAKEQEVSRDRRPGR